jgi:hypothetical protein
MALAARDGEGNAVERLHTANALADAVEHDHGRDGIFRL